MAAGGQLVKEGHKEECIGTRLQALREQKEAAGPHLLAKEN